MYTGCMEGGCIEGARRVYSGCIEGAWSEVRPDRMKPTAPPCRSKFLAPHTPHLCMFLGFLCAQAGEISPIYKWLRCALAFRPTFFFATARAFAQDKGSVGR